MGLAMPIAFAICFLFYIGLTETLRHGVFGMSASETESIIRTGLVLCAVFLLRADLLYVVRRPHRSLYGDSRLNWTWPRSLAGLLFGPLLLAVPIGYGIATLQVSYQPVVAEDVIEALLYETLFVALAAELFFREAAVKSFSGHPVAMILASVLSYGIYHIPDGAPAALMAGGAGLFYLALRLAGVNIMVVALVHATINVAQNQVFPLSTPGSEMWTYAIWFTVSVALVSLTLLSVTGPHRREVSYA